MPNELVLKVKMVQRPGQQWLWTSANPYEESIFKHFAPDGLDEVTSEYLEQLVAVAAIHGWDVERE